MDVPRLLPCGEELPVMFSESRGIAEESKELQLFSTVSPLEFVAIYFLEEFLNTKRANIFLLVIKEPFSKLKKT